MSKKINLAEILGATMPTKEELEEINKKNFLIKKNDVNNFSYWYPKIKNCGIKTPNSIVIPLSYEWYNWLQCDNYDDITLMKLNDFILEKINKEKFNYKKLFIKNNNFSGKFEFSNHCFVTDKNKLSKQFLELNYMGLIFGAGSATEIIIREFIENKEVIPTIYNGMPLNIEFRAFYDFDVKKLITICNYWDPETMGKNLIEDDLKTYNDYKLTLINDFNNHKKCIEDLLNTYLKNVNELSGIWSVDIMFVNETYYLIDMATAETSYYREKIKDYVNKKEL